MISSACVAVQEDGKMGIILIVQIASSRWYGHSGVSKKGSIAAMLRRNPQVHLQLERPDPILPSRNSTCHLPVATEENETSSPLTTDPSFVTLPSNRVG